MEKYYRDLLYELKFKLRKKSTKFWSRNKNISQRLEKYRQQIKKHTVPSTSTKEGETHRRVTLLLSSVRYRSR